MPTFGAFENWISEFRWNYNPIIHNTLPHIPITASFCLSNTHPHLLHTKLRSLGLYLTSLACPQSGHGKFLVSFIGT